MPVDPQADFVLVQAGFLFRLPSYSSTGQLERSLQPCRPGFTSWMLTPSSGSRLINDQNAIRRTRMLHDLLPQIIPHVIGDPSPQKKNRARAMKCWRFVGVCSPSSSASCQLPAIFPFHTADQSMQITLRMSTQIAPRKTRTNHTSHRSNLIAPDRNFLIRRHPCHPRIADEKLQNYLKSWNCNCNKWLRVHLALLNTRLIG
jgi:hypothetical protein